MIDMISGYDLVILQRCYRLDIAKAFRDACDFMGVPFVFETDDNYLDLESDNPAYWSIIPGEIARLNPPKHQLEEFRKAALEDYKQIINMASAVTVSTPELKLALQPYNREIYVLQNNVLNVQHFRHYSAEHEFIEDGQVKIRMMEDTRMITIPSYYVDVERNNSLVSTARIGYTGTPSHQGKDFNTVKNYWYKLIDKYSGKNPKGPISPNKITHGCWFTYIGDEFFYKEHETYRKGKEFRKRNIHIPTSEYDLYMQHLRNLDVGIAPLDKNIFNMAKSDIKAVELASWGIPCVLPSFVTYSRSFTHGENCLMYENGREFQECMEALILDVKLRTKLGEGALEYVENNRLEKLHSKARADIYRSLVDRSYKMKVFYP